MSLVYKLLLGFLLVILMTAMLGGYAVYSVSGMGALAIDMYNRPLMAINFARAAATDFARIDAAIARLQQPESLSERQRLLLHAAGADAAAAQAAQSNPGALVALVEEHLENFSDNIEVAHERALSADTRAAAERVAELAERWRSVNEALLAGDYSAAPQGQEFLQAIQTGLADLVEATAGEGFEFRLTAEEKVEHAKAITMIALGAALLLAFATILVLNQMIVRPLRRAVSVLNALSSGDTSADLDVRSNDEIGAIANAIQIFREKLLAMNRMEEEEVNARARAVAEKSETIRRLLDNFEQSVTGVVENVSAAATELQSTAQTMSDNAARAGDQSDSVVTASETAANGVQSVAVATEELSSSVEEINRQVLQSSEIAGRAVKQIELTNSTVRGLDEAAQKIGTVVKLISDIAEQTNLLALNATIEAARAGEAGKGFAVVANEVKSLAKQTANATHEISDQIEQMQDVTDKAIAAIRSIGQIIDQTNEIVATVSGTVDQQGSATREIARNVSSAAEGTRGVSTSIEEVRGVVRETGISAHQVLDSAQQLLMSSNTLRSAVAKFVEEVREESGLSGAAA